MHILFLSDNFPPEVNAPASRTFEHTREWVKAGHRVTVITCAPNFPKGKIYPGYSNRLWQRETIEGVEVIRVWSYITANEGFAKRVLDYTSYMVMAILASAFVRRTDIVVGTSPQFFTACAAYVVGTMKSIPWVFELRDIWPESIRAVGAMKASAMLDALEKFELFLYRKATAIVSVTHSFRDVLIRRGIDETKISVITNGVDIGRFQPRTKDPELLHELGLEGKFVAGYIGTHGLAHALDTLLDAAQMLGSATGGERYKLLLIGDGACKAALKARASAESLDNVVFVDSVPKEEVVRYWSLLDVAIIHLKATPLFETVIPSKLFECMGMTIPVLHGVSGESARIVEREQVGLTFEPENPAALCEGLYQLHDDAASYQRFKTNGLLAASHYDRTELGLRMLKLLSQTVDSNAA